MAMRSGRRDETGEAAEMLGASPAAVPKVSTACTMLGALKLPTTTPLKQAIRERRESGMNSLRNLWTDNALMLAAGLPDQELPAAALYVVGLPIGNMGDITLRALWVLSSVDAVAAEDTRETRKLLERFGIDTRLLSVREHNERHGAEQIDALLAEGQRVALEIGRAHV